MIRFIAIRLAGAIVVVWIVSVVTFLIFQAVPLLSHTNPVYFYTGKVPFPPGSPQLKALTHRFGFDLPLYAQYWHYLSGILFGQTITDGVSTPIPCPAPCFGYSFRQNDLVGTLLLRAAPVSLSLCIGAAILWLTGGVLVGGAVITESVFNIQGLGYLAINSALTQDLPIVAGVVLLAAVAVALANLAVDIVYAFLDPRVRYA